jgi:SAM-dependent methyltransferase
MNQMLEEKVAVPKMRCPSCGYELGYIPESQQTAINCAQCHYQITRDGDCWDACVDKTYPRDFARQWLLWEAGKLGNPNLVYGHDPKDYFRTLLKVTSLTPEQLGSMKILEIGFGHGRVLRELQRCSQTAYGLDLSKPLPSAQLRPGSTIFGNLLDNPFIPGQFDLVICRGVIHCTPDPEKSFDRVAEQVAGGGLLYLAGLYEPGKGNLVLRKLLPKSSSYPESVLLAFASVFGLVRSVVEAVRTGKIGIEAIKRFYGHYKLDVFDVMAPQWTSVHTEAEVSAWFRKRGFSVRKVDYGNYLGVKIGS